MNSTETYRSFTKSIFNTYSLLSDDTLASLLAIASIQHLKKGTILLEVGQISKHIHLLYGGAVVSYYLHNDGNLYHKNIFLEGDFVGSTVSAITQKPSHFALEVVEDATLISLDYSQYRALMEDHPDLKDFYIAYLEKNWVIDKEKREIEIVLTEARERYLDFIQKHPDIENRVPLRYIASHLGITPTQLSRIRKKLQEI
ncbi:cAMP-binding domain of CRP or a regulatory subunit of cAMP-dependent protein kinases [Zhouia amylolytica]|uniref:cAMP-binding domain of CRP or a regulatory subunit of cAMP-dependent protein kinases n=1 Tax=Zhouia amylolytica TaxID=376730 RepID=A0A1I6UMB0_9FLAO|nr:Crp/Fnr family transcriptional regulator [Zhouia amylolytica]SFT02528.1 cAMP-binding domain of CRP or a regulatory subunit of cAMP-dependent protein kinases [Zhouia amylolytica]